MNTIDVKAHVRQAIDSSWDQFQRYHPHLANVIDRELLAEAAAQSLGDDPQFQDAMQRSSGLGIAASTLTDLIPQLVKRFLERLF